MPPTPTALPTPTTDVVAAMTNISAHVGNTQAAQILIAVAVLYVMFRFINRYFNG
jgi:hypothetical protein